MLTYSPGQIDGRPCITYTSDVLPSLGVVLWGEMHSMEAAERHAAQLNREALAADNAAAIKRRPRFFPTVRDPGEFAD